MESILNSRRIELNLEWKIKSNRLQNIICISCNKSFKPARRTQTTCSRACSNTAYRSGVNHYMYDIEKQNYRTICFAHYKKECIVCGETNIVAVHHYDENHENNEPSNLVPLCPTHHQYMHSKYKYLIRDKVENWRTSIALLNTSVW